MTGQASSGSAFYRDLGAYSDWVEHARRSASIRWGIEPASLPAGDPTATRASVLEVLQVGRFDESALDLHVEERWEDDGLEGERLSWDVGYGPRAEAFVLRPAGSVGPLPGVLALHCHSGFKYYGKEKVADGPGGMAPGLEDLRARAYGGRAFANALARAGFVVLAHDVFTWGSRRFVLEEVIEQGDDQGCRAGTAPARRLEATIQAYNEAAALHEHVVEKYCRVLRTSFSAVVSREDRIALSYLISRPDVDSERVGCVGLSGGGLRAGMLQATSDKISAAVVVAMMSTYAGLLDHNVASHTWMLYPEGWPARGDWPDLVGCRPLSPLLVQYNRDDALFSADGMIEADRVLRARYETAGNSHGYVGELYDGPHKFDVAMQDAAFSWLGATLRPGGDLLG